MLLTLDDVQAINASINNAVGYTTDHDRYGKEDWWEDALSEDGKGDCEDYAIAKMRALLAAGCPRGSLKLALCRVETGEYHCVLVVEIDGVDWVLDNRIPMATQWDLLPYTWDRMYLLGERQWRMAGKNGERADA